MEDLELVRNFIFSTFDKIIVVYFGNWLLTIVVSIYVIRKLSKLIDKLR